MVCREKDQTITIKAQSSSFPVFLIRFRETALWTLFRNVSLMMSYPAFLSQIASDHLSFTRYTQWYYRDNPWIEPWFLPGFETHTECHVPMLSPCYSHVIPLMCSPIIFWKPLLVDSPGRKPARHHQVRILKLENTGQNRTIVSAMIDSADIWECLDSRHLGGAWTP